MQLLKSPKVQHLLNFQKLPDTEYNFKNLIKEFTIVV